MFRALHKFCFGKKRRKESKSLAQEGNNLHIKYGKQKYN